MTAEARSCSDDVSSLLRGRQRYDRRRHRTLRLRVEREHKPFELRVQEIGAKLEVFHLCERTLTIPPFVDHAVRGCHDAGPMPTAYAMDKHRLVLRVIDNFQELIELSFGRRDMAAHRDFERLHPRAI